jgi:hypothetical protein
MTISNSVGSNICETKVNQVFRRLRIERRWRPRGKPRSQPRWQHSCNGYESICFGSRSAFPANVWSGSNFHKVLDPTFNIFSSSLQVSWRYFHGIWKHYGTFHIKLIFTITLWSKGWNYPKILDSWGSKSGSATLTKLTDNRGQTVSSSRDVIICCCHLRCPLGHLIWIVIWVVI